MTRTIGIGVIGMGWMGEVHSRSYRAIPDRFHESGIFPRIVVCSDSVEARAQAAKPRFGFERYTTDWRTVIADPEVEIVNVAAPNGMHLEINRAAAQAGKHIFCEKPVGYDDLKVIEAYNFLTSVVTGQQGEPGFAEALAVANVQQAIIRSWKSERWETVEHKKG